MLNEEREEKKRKRGGQMGSTVRQTHTKRRNNIYNLSLQALMFLFSCLNCLFYPLCCQISMLSGLFWFLLFWHADDVATNYHVTWF